MNEKLTPQKERFLQELERKLLRKELDAKLMEDGLLHVGWNEHPLCSVDGNGTVRFRPADITGPKVDRQLRMVTQTAEQVKEYMRIFERAPALKVAGLEDTYKVLADFGDAVLAGRSCKTGAKFVTWEWDFDRQGVHAGHYFMENYEAAKKDFSIRAGLAESQRDGCFVLFDQIARAERREDAQRVDLAGDPCRLQLEQRLVGGELGVALRVGNDDDREGIRVAQAGAQGVVLGLQRQRAGEQSEKEDRFSHERDGLNQSILCAPSEFTLGWTLGA